MISDLISHASHYSTLGPRFAAGLKWLSAFSRETADGRYDIDGDHVYALVQSYTTVPASEKKYESHRLHADIQFIAAGAESILYVPTDALTAETAYDSQKDYLLYADPEVAATPLAMEPGRFAIFLAHDGHKPGCVAGSPSSIKKVVIKVRL